MSKIGSELVLLHKACANKRLKALKRKQTWANGITKIYPTFKDKLHCVWLSLSTDKSRSQLPPLDFPIWQYKKTSEGQGQRTSKYQNRKSRLHRILNLVFLVGMNIWMRHIILYSFVLFQIQSHTPFKPPTANIFILNTEPLLPTLKLMLRMCHYPRWAMGFLSREIFSTDPGFSLEEFRFFP